MPRAAVIYGQFGVAADPINLPTFRNRLAAAGIETTLVEHYDRQKVYDFFRGYEGKRGIFGSSLGAGASPLYAGDQKPHPVDIVGGFQPSDWDPIMHLDPVTKLKTVIVPSNVKHAICFRNPVFAITGGLGHAIYKAEEPSKTMLEIKEREDVHPGDFGPAQDYMFDAAVKALK
jgi:hypothetical protein